MRRAAIGALLWTALRPRGCALADASALGAFAYVLAGGMAASALAFVGPMMRADQPAFARLSLALAVLAPIGALFTVLDHIVMRYAALGPGLPAVDGLVSVASRSPLAEASALRTSP